MQYIKDCLNCFWFVANLCCVAKWFPYRFSHDIYWGTCVNYKIDFFFLWMDAITLGKVGERYDVERTLVENRFIIRLREIRILDQSYLWPRQTWLSKMSNFPKFITCFSICWAECPGVKLWNIAVDASSGVFFWVWGGFGFGFLVFECESFWLLWWHFGQWDLCWLNSKLPDLGLFHPSSNS